MEVTFLDIWVFRWKLYKFPMSNLKVKRQVSFSLHHSSISWEITLLYFFSGNFNDFSKKSPPKYKISDFWLLRWNSPNLYFDSLLLLKVYKILAKKVQWSYIYLMILKSETKFEKKLICCFKNDKNLVNFDPTTQKTKKFALSLVPFVLIV